MHYVLHHAALGSVPRSLKDPLLTNECNVTGFLNMLVAARDAGITEFLAKPVSSKALYQRIVSVIANPRPFIKTKTYFGPDRRRNINPGAYTGPERRKGGKAETIRQQALMDRVKTAAT